jgi:predicted PurR-regulated permease PerM
MNSQNQPELPSGYFNKNLEVIIRIGLVIGLVFWCFLILKPFLLITLWSVILAVAVYPMYNKLSKVLGNKRIIASLIVTLIMLLIIILPIILLGSSLAEGVIYLKNVLTSGNSIIPHPDPAVKEWPLIGPSLYELWSHASLNMAEVAVEYKEQLTSGLTWFLTTLTNAGLGLLIFIGSVIISGVMLVFSSQSGKGIKLLAVRLMGEKGEEMVENAELTVRNVARGILGVAFIQAFLAGIGFLVAGIPGAGFWALIGFILGVVQIGVGPVIIGVLIYAFLKLSTLTAVLLLIYSIIPMAIDNVLKPILLGRNAPVPMLVVFLGAIGGFISMGTIGLFIGAVVLSLGYDLFLVWLKNE